jgi:hypothetical protein
MRARSFLLVLVAIMLVAPVVCPASARAQAAPSFDAAGTDAKQVASFLKTLQASVALDNRLKVASLVEFPLAAWAGGRELTIRNEGEFHGRYSQIFDAALRREIAAATVDSLAASQEGIAIGGGRLVVRSVPGHKNGLRIVAINQAGEAR